MTHLQDRQQSFQPNIFIVESILKHRRKRKNRLEYFIKWKGWGESFNSWEPENNILDESLVQEYWSRLSFASNNRRHLENIKAPLKFRISVANQCMLSASADQGNALQEPELPPIELCRQNDYADLPQPLALSLLDDNLNTISHVSEKHSSPPTSLGLNKDLANNSSQLLSHQTTKLSTQNRRRRRKRHKHHRHRSRSKSEYSMLPSYAARDIHAMKSYRQITNCNYAPTTATTTACAKHGNNNQVGRISRFQEFLITRPKLSDSCLYEIKSHQGLQPRAVTIIEYDNDAINVDKDGLSVFGLDKDVVSDVVHPSHMDLSMHMLSTDLGLSNLRPKSAGHQPGCTDSNENKIVDVCVKHNANRQPKHAVLKQSISNASGNCQPGPLNLPCSSSEPRSSFLSSKFNAYTNRSTTEAVETAADGICPDKSRDDVLKIPDPSISTSKPFTCFQSVSSHFTPFSNCSQLLPNGISFVQLLQSQNIFNNSSSFTDQLTALAAYLPNNQDNNMP